MDPSLPHRPPARCSRPMLQAQLCDPALLASWLREAAEAPLVLQDARLQVLIAQHRNTPAEVRVNLIRLLPLASVVAILDSHDLTPDTRFLCTVHVNQAWAKMAAAERQAFAEVATEPIWDLLWRTADATTLSGFLNNPRLGPLDLARLIQPPLTRAQAEALQESRFRANQDVIFRVLTAMALSFHDPGTDLVLGLAAPWIKTLTPQERLLLAPALSYPPMERLAELWGTRISPPA